jgi:hypothetical protein
VNNSCCCRLLYCHCYNTVYSHCLPLGCQDIPSGRKKGLCCLRFASHQHVSLFHHITFSLPLQPFNTHPSLGGHDLCTLQGLRSPPRSSEALLQTHYFPTRTHPDFVRLTRHGSLPLTLTHASLLASSSTESTNHPHQYIRDSITQALRALIRSTATLYW